MALKIQKIATAARPQNETFHVISPAIKRHLPRVFPAPGLLGIDNCNGCDNDTDMSSSSSFYNNRKKRDMDPPPLKRSRANNSSGGNPRNRSIHLDGIHTEFWMEYAGKELDESSVWSILWARNYRHERDGQFVLVDDSDLIALTLKYEVVQESDDPSKRHVRIVGYTIDCDGDGSGSWSL